MRFITLAAVVAVSLVPASSALAAPTSHIANGRGVDQARHDAMWPFLIELDTDGEKPFDSHTCGAVLIHPKLVLTAAHCIVSEEVDPSERARSIPESIGVTAGSPTMGGGQRLRVQDVFVHPGYGSNPARWQDDIAMLRLAKPAKLGPSVALGRVVAPEEDVWWGAGAGLPDTEATGPWVAGWGNMQVWDTSERYPDQLQEVLVPIVEDAACVGQAPPAIGIDPLDFLCAGALDSNTDPADGSTGRDACGGDSGGPLVAGDGAGQWRVVGLVSHGQKCAGNTYLAYTRLASYRSWIASISPANGTGVGGIKPVRQLTTKQRTRTSVTLAWKPPVGGAASYTVYGNVGEGVMQRWAYGKAPRARITGIEPGAYIEVYVVARSASGDESVMKRYVTWTND